MNKAHTILVIDDDPELSKYLGAVVKTAGFDIILASTGLDALKAFDENITGIILDLSMPKMDGIEFLRELAKRNLSTAIILISAFERQVLESASLVAQSRGFNVLGTLNKPFRYEALRDLICKFGELPQKAQSSRPKVTENDLWQAIYRDEFFLDYQPQVSLRDGAWEGVEALVRWRHPELGVLFPSAFIDIVERNGNLASDLIAQVIKKSAEDIQKCGHGLGRYRTVSINVSPIGLTDLSFPELVDSVVSQYNLEKRRIRFEVTETSIAEDPTVLMDILTRLRLKGYTLSIDDFGTGHATFENLRELPLDEIKIDTNFVRAGLRDPVAKIIAERTVALGHDLHLVVIAEGIEDLDSWCWLRDLHCDYGQGYYIARPMPPKMLAAWARKWRTPST